MIHLSKKTAFSLIESIVSLMILSMVVTLTLATITKKRPPKPKRDPGGIFACWHDANGLHQTQYAGQTKVFDHIISETDGQYICDFEMNRRVTKYYIVKFGSRDCYNGKCVDGQITFERYSTPGGDDDDQLKFQAKIGKKNTYSTTGDSSFYPKYQIDELEGGNVVDGLAAIGGILPNDSEIVPKNISSCIISNNINDNECNKKYTCSFNSAVTNIGSGNYQTQAYININCEDASGARTIYISNLDNLKKTANDGIYTFKADGKPYCIENNISKTLNSDVEIKIQEKDPLFKAKVNNELADSRFIKFLNVLPGEYVNDLTAKLRRYYLDDSNKSKDGVVLILW